MIINDGFGVGLYSVSSRIGKFDFMSFFGYFVKDGMDD